MLVTPHDLRVVKYDKQFKVQEDVTCGVHVHQDSKTRYIKTELNRQANRKEKDLQAVIYDRTHTLAGKPIGDGSTSDMYRLICQDTVTVIMSNWKHGHESIEVVMNREKAWLKAQGKRQGYKP